MINKLEKSALLEAEEKAFRWAIINAVNQIIEAVNVGVVWDNKVTSERADEALDVKIEDVNATQSISFVALAESGQIDEVTATEHSELFIEWIEGLDCYAGRIVKRNDALYQVNEGQGHTAQTGWEPENAPSLFKKIGDPAEEYPQWSQPLGEHDAYDKGAKVTYNEQHYISAVENNVWRPDVYGWELVPEE